MPLVVRVSPRFAFALAASFPIAIPAATAPALPNIVVIVADDVGWGDFQCYNAAGKVPTPNIDRLARHGMRFTHAHTPVALCAPTRYSLLTGNYPWRGRLSTGTWGFSEPPQILPGQRTVGHFLQQAGYRTALLGKTHLGGTFARRAEGGIDWSKPMEVGPREWGFDYSGLLLGGHQAPPYLYIKNNRVDGDATRVLELKAGDLNGGQIQKAGPGLPDWDSRHVSAELLRRAQTFIDECLASNRADGRDRPFFLHFNTDGAHSPYTPPDEIAGTPVRGATKMTEHTDMVFAVDVVVGKLVDSLTRHRLLANTLIVVTSDNGGIPDERQFGHDAVQGLRGHKSDIWEGGHRVPFIVHWGDGTPQGSRISPGSVRHQIVGVHDIVATFADIAGVTPGANQALDSVTLLPILLGERDDETPVRSSLLVQSAPVRDTSQMPAFPGPKVPAGEAETPERKPDMAFAVYESDWKLIVGPREIPAGLFHISRDLGEENNLLRDPAQAGRLQRMLETFHGLRRSARSIPATLATPVRAISTR